MRVAQKLPDDWECLCEKSFLNIAYGIKEEDIPSQLLVNMDQTQIVYAQGSKLTWVKAGGRQVTIIGEDEKCAFTVVVSVLNSRELLPSRKSTRDNQPNPVHPNQHQIIMLQKWLVFDLNTQKQKLTGQYMK
jgi:hypothetical protein